MLLSVGSNAPDIADMDDANFEKSISNLLEIHDSVIVLFTATEAKYACYYCHNLWLEFEKVHKAYSQMSDKGKNLVFARVDYGVGRKIFKEVTKNDQMTSVMFVCSTDVCSQLRIKSVPKIYHIGQGGIGASGTDDIFSFNDQTGFSANIIADFINHRAQAKVGEKSKHETLIEMKRDSRIGRACCLVGQLLYAAGSSSSRSANARVARRF